MRSSTCEVDEEQSAPRPVLGRAGDGPGGGEAAEACACCRFEGDDAGGEADVSRGEAVAEEGEELCVGTRSGQRATEAARTTPLAGEGGCEVFCGEAGGEAVAPIAVARPSLERRDSLSQSSGETAGCGSAVATWLGPGLRMRVSFRARGRGRGRGRGRVGVRVRVRVSGQGQG